MQSAAQNKQRERTSKKQERENIPLSPIYTMKTSLRHATAMADLYYFVANPVKLVENTHDKPTPSLRPGFPMSQCMLSQKLNLIQVLR